jgi:hypothetical protein
MARRRPRGVELTLAWQNTEIRKASLVLKGGVAYAPAQVYEALGIRPFVPAATIVSTSPRQP